MQTFKEFLTESSETIDSAEFIWRCKRDLNYAANQKTPLTVTEFVNLNYGKITGISPFVTFKGPVFLAGCPHLKKISGTYYNELNAKHSAVEEVDVTIKRRQDFPSGVSMLDLSSCGKLQYVRGTVGGCVNLSESTVNDISGLRVDAPEEDKSGCVGIFYRCHQLKALSGSYNGNVNAYWSGAPEIKDLHITGTDDSGVGLYLRRSVIKKISNFTCEGEIDADEKTLELIAKYQAEKMVGKTEEGPIDELF
jgi:hypothetical protein